MSASSASSSSSSGKRGKAASAAAPSHDPDAIAKAMNGLSKSQVAFTKSVEDCKGLIENTFQDIDVQLSRKRKEIEELDQEFRQSKRAKTIDLEQEMKAFGREQALKILADNKEKAVSMAEWDKLQHELATLRQDQSAALAQVANQERAKYEKELQLYKTTSDLKHTSEVATQNASIEQLRNHIDILEKQIKTLQGELANARELTRQVAESSRPVYSHPPQYSGKN